jgi:hypothetical protein
VLKEVSTLTIAIHNLQAAICSLKRAPIDFAPSPRHLHIPAVAFWGEVKRESDCFVTSENKVREQTPQRCTNPPTRRPFPGRFFYQRPFVIVISHSNALSAARAQDWDSIQAFRAEEMTQCLKNTPEDHGHRPSPKSMFLRMLGSPN